LTVLLRMSWRVGLVDVVVERMAGTAAALRDLVMLW